LRGGGRRDRLYLVQTAKKVPGIEKAVPPAGSEEKCQYCRGVLGADITLDYKDVDPEA